ncbi:hypothetical protein DXG01_001862 [Tephrocybe rancida]|nr:hypothetical protein DXG01_001862 [Tephrocybe rancida]
MTNIDDFMKEDKVWCTHVTFIEDGHVLQTPEQHVEWTLRSLINVNAFFISQLPQEYDMQMNPDMFLKSFSFTQNSQQRKNAPGWRSQAPIVNKDPMVVNEDFTEEQRTNRLQAYLTWKQFVCAVGGHVLYLVAKGKVPALHERRSKMKNATNNVTKHPSRYGRPRATIFAGKQVGPGSDLKTKKNQAVRKRVHDVRIAATQTTEITTFKRKRVADDQSSPSKKTQKLTPNKNQETTASGKGEHVGGDKQRHQTAIDNDVSTTRDEVL